MGQNFSTLLMDTHLGKRTSQAWCQRAHGVITWFSMVLQTAFGRASTWSAVWRITMTYWSAQSMMILVATDLCWVTCMSSTMLVLSHMEGWKMCELALSNFKSNEWVNGICSLRLICLTVGKKHFCPCPYKWLRPIAHVRYIEILTWLRGFLVIFLYLIWVSFLYGIARQWSGEKFAVLFLNPRSHFRFLIYRTWAICNMFAILQCYITCL